jgi:hypothetical protein
LYTQKLTLGQPGSVRERPPAAAGTPPQATPGTFAYLLDAFIADLT